MKLRITYVPPESLKDAGGGSRKITKKALVALAEVMDQHGFITPVIVRRHDRLILDGHQRLRANALRETPDPLVPCVLVSGVSDERAVALNIALNNPALQGHFNEKRLAAALLGLRGTEMDVSAATGFTRADLAEVDEVIEILSPVADPADMKADPDATADGSSVENVVVVFEIERELFGLVKPRFDELIARYGLACHVRMEDGR